MAAKLMFVMVLIGLIVIKGRATLGEGNEGIDKAEIELGERLFNDDRFCSPRGDLRNSCSSCHMTDQSPEGARAFTDFLTRSWVPWRAADPRRDGFRNAPTIFDLADAPRLHYDGEFTSLEDLARGTLTGRSMGWLAGEETGAIEYCYAVLMSDKGQGNSPSYRTQFNSVYRADIAGLGGKRVVELASKSLAEYMRTLRTGRNTPYDQFARANGLPAGLAAKEKPKEYSARLLAELIDLERAGKLKSIPGFNEQAIDGLKLFMRTEGDRAGNCAVCHTPPLFTDFSFHNVGVSQAEYDSVHRDGSFARLAIPAADRAIRPVAGFKETPRSDRPEYADLGYWNFVDLGGPERRAGESADDLLRRMIGAIKTPTLRNLAYSYPYMHNGMFPTLEDAIGEILEMSELSRAGKVRSADPELAKIMLRESDIAPLRAFLRTLNDDLDRRYRNKH